MNITWHRCSLTCTSDYGLPQCCVIKKHTYRWLYLILLNKHLFFVIFLLVYCSILVLSRVWVCRDVACAGQKTQRYIWVMVVCFTMGETTVASLLVCVRLLQMLTVISKISQQFNNVCHYQGMWSELLMDFCQYHPAVTGYYWCQFKMNHSRLTKVTILMQVSGKNRARETFKQKLPSYLWWRVPAAANCCCIHRDLSLTKITSKATKVTLNFTFNGWRYSSTL